MSLPDPVEVRVNFDDHNLPNNPFKVDGGKQDVLYRNNRTIKYKLDASSSVDSWKFSSIAVMVPGSSTYRELSKEGQSISGTPPCSLKISKWGDSEVYVYVENFPRPENLKPYTIAVKLQVTNGKSTLESDDPQIVLKPQD